MIRLAAGLAGCFLCALSALAQPVDDTALMATRPAVKLSAYRLFAPALPLTPNAGVHPYDLATPLFTDYAVKSRHVYVPAGKLARYDAREAFEFPVGSVIAKTFAFPADLRAPAENVRVIETRLLIHQADGWQAWAYVWNGGGSDAALKVAGDAIPVNFIDHDGEARSIRYVIPNKNQCKGCHSLDGVFTPLGPKARNLNHDFAYAIGPHNQLAYWTEHGLLSGAPADPAAAPRTPAWNDETASLEARARGYLDVNCAHCHRAEGPASTSGLFLTSWEDNPVVWGRMKRPVAAGRGAGSFDFDIVPGKPEQSILTYRMKSNDPGVMMPEIGRTIVDAEGVALIEAWIAGLK